MSLSAFGINHQSASIDFRERVSFSENQASEAIRTLCQTGLTREAVIFSTCNRTEFYFAGLADQEAFYTWLADEKSLSIDALKDHSYFLTQPAVPAHLFRVASGLDSIALGEPQILGQVKAAYQLAQQQQGTQQQLSYLFQEAFHVAKNVRSSTQLGENSISIAYAAIKLADRFFSHYQPLTALIIGAGETGALAAKTLHKKQLSKLIIANRTLEKAQTLALELGGYAITPEQIPDHLHEADIIISATHKDGHMISADLAKLSLSKRKKRLQLYLDLAVPRDFDPSIKTLDNCYLYAVDDLDDIIKNNQALRQKAAVEAEMLVEHYTQRFSEWINLRKNNSLLKQLHESAQNDKDYLLQEALKQLETGQDATAVLTMLANKLSKKLTHSPSLLIRKACQEDNKALLNEIIELYQFKP